MEICKVFLSSNCYCLSTDFLDTLLNRKAAEQKAQQIELDFASGNFDPSLGKYEQQFQHPNPVSNIDYRAF
ncbi:MAG: DUF3596 domain-containing protein [Leptolyngbyaceae cyanobacterium MO_188.B28]|nr:DUF3596 domain-containing protein [Leptolyngbyaceae cyanobacterium MO_188.B28]